MSNESTVSSGYIGLKIDAIVDRNPKELVIERKLSKTNPGYIHTLLMTSEFMIQHIINLNVKWYTSASKKSKSKSKNTEPKDKMLKSSVEGIKSRSAKTIETTTETIVTIDDYVPEYMDFSDMKTTTPETIAPNKDDVLKIQFIEINYMSHIYEKYVRHQRFPEGECKWGEVSKYSFMVSARSSSLGGGTEK